MTGGQWPRRVAKELRHGQAKLPDFSCRLFTAGFLTPAFARPWLSCRVLILLLLLLLLVIFFPDRNHPLNLSRSVFPDTPSESGAAWPGNGCRQGE